MSCGKAQKVFEQEGIEIKAVADARKEKIGREKAWELIRHKKAVVIGKGKTRLTFTPEETMKEEILKAALGRSGNLRAPSIDTGDTLLIGYNDQIYEGL